MSAEWMDFSKKQVMVSKEAWKRSNQEAKEKAVRQSDILSWVLESYLAAVAAGTLPGVREAGLERRRFLDWRKAFVSKEAAEQLKQAAKATGVSMDKVIRPRWTGTCKRLRRVPPAKSRGNESISRVLFESSDDWEPFHLRAMVGRRFVHKVGKILAGEPVGTRFVRSILPEGATGQIVYLAVQANISRPPFVPIELLELLQAEDPRLVQNIHPLDLRTSGQRNGTPS